jgi:hypothetical protein
MAQRRPDSRIVLDEKLMTTEQTMTPERAREDWITRVITTCKSYTDEDDLKKVIGLLHDIAIERGAQIGISEVRAAMEARTAILLAPELPA